MNPKRIIILGISGSGKTTLANQISEKLNIQSYDLDDIFFTRKFDKKRGEKSREKLFNNLVKKRKWIIEGVYTTWIEEGIKKSDLVILLDIPFRKTSYRVSKRYFSRKGEHRETLKDLIKLINFIRKYKSKKNKRGYGLHKSLIDKHKADFIILKTKKEINSFLENYS